MKRRDTKKRAATTETLDAMDQRDWKQDKEQGN